MEQIKIQRKQRKPWFSFIASLAFIGFGCWFILAPATFKTVPLATPTVVMIAGILTVLYFGWSIWHSGKQLVNFTPAVLIDANGITDNAVDFPLGFMPWNDITGIRKTEVGGSKFVLIDLAHPEAFIHAETVETRRNAFSINYKNCGTPASIATSGLSVSADALEVLLNREFKKYQPKR